MAWPSGTKASTTNVDNGADLISNARADIKQNIDNVNDIIDHLNISSPNNGDILQYSTATGKWEQVASTSIGSTNPIFVGMNQGSSTTAGNTTNVTYQPLESAFTTGGATYASNILTLAAGTYALELVANVYCTKTNGMQFGFYDTTNTQVLQDEDTNNYNFTITYSSGQQSDWTGISFIRKLNLGSSTNIRLYVQASSAQAGNMGIEGAIVRVYEI